VELKPAHIVIVNFVTITLGVVVVIGNTTIAVEVVVICTTFGLVLRHFEHHCERPFEITAIKLCVFSVAKFAVCVALVNGLRPNCRTVPFHCCNCFSVEYYTVFRKKHPLTVSFIAQ